MKLAKLLFEEKYKFNNDTYVTVIELQDLYGDEEIPEQSVEFSEDNFKKMIKQAYGNINKDKVEEIYKNFNKEFGEVTDWPELLIVSIKNSGEKVYGVFPDTEELHSVLENKDGYSLYNKYVKEFGVIAGEAAESDTIERYLKLTGRWKEESTPQTEGLFPKKKNPKFKKFFTVDPQILQTGDYNKPTEIEKELRNIENEISDEKSKEKLEKSINDIKNNSTIIDNIYSILRTTINKTLKSVTISKKEIEDFYNYISILKSVILDLIYILNTTNNSKIRSFKHNIKILENYYKKIAGITQPLSTISKNYIKLIYNKNVLNIIQQLINIITGETSTYTESIENNLDKLILLLEEDLGDTTQFVQNNIKWIKELTNKIKELTNKINELNNDNFNKTIKRILEIIKEILEDINKKIENSEKESSLTKEQWENIGKQLTIIERLIISNPTMIILDGEEYKLAKGANIEDLKKDLQNHIKEIYKIFNTNQSTKKPIKEPAKKPAKQPVKKPINNLIDQLTKTDQDTKSLILYNMMEIYRLLGNDESAKEVQEISQQISQEQSNKVKQKINNLFDGIFEKLNITRTENESLLQYIQRVKEEIEKEAINKIKITPEFKNEIDKNIFNDIVKAIEMATKQVKGEIIYKSDIYKQYQKIIENYLERNIKDKTNFEEYARIKFMSTYDMVIHNSKNFSDEINQALQSNDMPISIGKIFQLSKYMSFINGLINYIYDNIDEIKKMEKIDGDKKKLAIIIYNYYETKLKQQPEAKATENTEEEGVNEEELSDFSQK